MLIISFIFSQEPIACKLKVEKLITIDDTEILLDIKRFHDFHN